MTAGIVNASQIIRYLSNSVSASKKPCNTRITAKSANPQTAVTAYDVMFFRMINSQPKLTPVPLFLLIVAVDEVAGQYLTHRRLVYAVIVLRDGVVYYPRAVFLCVRIRQRYGRQK